MPDEIVTFPRTAGTAVPPVPLHMIAIVVCPGGAPRHPAILSRRAVVVGVSLVCEGEHAGNPYIAGLAGGREGGETGGA